MDYALRNLVQIRKIISPYVRYVYVSTARFVGRKQKLPEHLNVLPPYRIFPNCQDQRYAANLP